MKIHLEKAIFINKAPFDKLELDFIENEIAVLSAVNGRGKTTILSHIVDAFHEFSRPYFSNEYKGKETKFYRISSQIYNLDINKPSFVYLRFKIGGEIVDYLDVRNTCTAEEYNRAITIENKIPFGRFQQELKDSNYTKSISAHFNKEKAEDIFKNNLLTYFPAYRYEQPGYLNDPYKIKLDFKKTTGYLGFLPNRIEVISGLPELANWIMDVVLDLQYPDTNVGLLKNNLDSIVTQSLSSKTSEQLGFAVGPRGFGGTRIQVVKAPNNESLYPSIFNLSSGESSLLCLFGELLRQADNNENNIPMDDITGIVLVDEIDKHLHIKLQKEVLPKLLDLFPNVQFIVSSHSPFLSMGLAEELQDRSKIIDLDNLGISKDPTTNELYKEVYDMMIGENERFKERYESIMKEVELDKVLQIITEGKNISHIEKAISVIEPIIIKKIKIISGAEDKSGDQQLKNAFEIMSKCNTNKFLFVWDCDSISMFEKVSETSNFLKFCFEQNNSNEKIPKGIENLYPESLFTDDLYDKKVTPTAYGGSKEELIFNKNKFLDKINRENEEIIFKNFEPLIEKIKNIVNSKIDPEI